LEHPPEAYRPPLRMKSRILFFAAAALLVMVAAILFMLLARVEEPLPLFPARVDRDCAPWDGAAFTMSIPLDKETITISIYQPPNIQRFVRFSFPDETLREGHALLVLPVDVPETLTGQVSFQRVEQGVPVDGQFDLSTEGGRHFKGTFLADWGNETVYCG
jgi:hypothetical protein